MQVVIIAIKINILAKNRQPIIVENMIIPLRLFQKNEYHLKLNAEAPWLMTVFKNLFSENNFLKDSIQGEILLKNTNDNISLQGFIEFSYEPFCDHCGESLRCFVKIPLRAILSPFPKGDFSEKETELTHDIDFCFYQNQEIEVDPIINDEIALALPYNHYCENKEACKKRASPYLTPDQKTD